MMSSIFSCREPNLYQMQTSNPQKIIQKLVRQQELLARDKALLENKSWPTLFAIMHLVVRMDLGYALVHHLLALGSKCFLGSCSVLYFKWARAQNVSVLTLAFLFAICIPHAAQCTLLYLLSLGLHLTTAWVQCRQDHSFHSMFL